MFQLKGIDTALATERQAAAAGVLEQMRRLRDAGQFPPFNEGNFGGYYLNWANDETLWNMLPVAGNPLDHTMVLGAVKQADAIGHGVWMVDIHDPRGTGYTTYTDRGTRNMLVAGTSYHVPLGMCLNDRVSNLAVVGRCASSTHEAHSSVRVQTHCMVMGQGIGTAAPRALLPGRSSEHFSLECLRLFPRPSHRKRTHRQRSAVDGRGVTTEGTGRERRGRR